MKDGKEWTASTENDKRPLLTVWWPSKAIQASYLNYMKEQGLGTNQTYTSFSSQTQMDQAALEVQKRIEERIAREGNTDWLRTTIKNFVKTQPGWNSTSENLDNSDHLQGGALLYNNDSRTSHANSDYRLLNRTPTSQTGKHNPKYTKDTSNGGFEFLLANDIDNSNYRQILVSLNFSYDTFDIAEISDDKITILIDTNIIRMTADNLKFMRENYPNQTFYYIRNSIEKYIDIVDETLFSQEELLEILTWDISDKLKIRLLELSDGEISIIGKNYSPAVCLHILNNNFAKSDLPDLFSSFEQWDNFIQAKIFDYAIRHIASIIDDPNSASQKLTNNLLHSERVNRDEKIDLFIAIIPVLCEDSIKGILPLLNLTDYLKIFDTRSRPKFEINDENEKLLVAFKKAGMIDNYKESSEKEGYYKITRHKPAVKALPQELL